MQLPSRHPAPQRRHSHPRSLLTGLVSLQPTPSTSQLDLSRTTHLPLPIESGAAACLSGVGETLRLIWPWDKKLGGRLVGKEQGLGGRIPVAGPAGTTWTGLNGRACRVDLVWAEPCSVLLVLGVAYSTAFGCAVSYLIWHWRDLRLSWLVGLAEINGMDFMSGQYMILTTASLGRLPAICIDAKGGWQPYPRSMVV